MNRPELAQHIATLVGSGLLTITAPQQGWPALGRLKLDDREVDIALFVGEVGLSHRNRDDVERRFQNPGQNHPIVIPPGRQPLLLGLWEGDSITTPSRPILVSADARRREGLLTRYSVFAGLGALRAAETTGWAESTSASGEIIRCLFPPLLPVSAMAQFDSVIVAPDAIKVAVEAAGLDVAADIPAIDAAATRARRAASTLIRDARFSRRVTEAYRYLCAMCGLDLGLVQGAHIYPASAPGSPDEPWNGLSLCANHHLAFDRHLVWVHPNDRGIIIHPEVLDQRSSSPAVAAMVDGTYPQLAEPVGPHLRPRSEMFERRYTHFGESYRWAA